MTKTGYRLETLLSPTTGQLISPMTTERARALMTMTTKSKKLCFHSNYCGIHPPSLVTICTYSLSSLQVNIKK